MATSEVLPLALLAALMLGITARWRGWLRPRPRRVHYASVDAQIDGDFAPHERAEAHALIDELASHARPDDRERVRRTVVDAVRGDLAKLRRSAPKSAAALERIYRLLGDPAPATDDNGDA